jgi:hypothetical protein
MYCCTSVVMVGANRRVGFGQGQMPLRRKLHASAPPPLAGQGLLKEPRCSHRARGRQTTDGALGPVPPLRENERHRVDRLDSRVALRK